VIWKKSHDPSIAVLRLAFHAQAAAHVIEVTLLGADGRDAFSDAVSFGNLVF
jgi:hypothetical protein